MTDSNSKSSARIIDLAGVAVCLALGALFYFGCARPLWNSRQNAIGIQQQLADRRTRNEQLSQSLQSAKTKLDQVRQALLKSRLKLEISSKINNRLSALAILATRHQLEITDLHSGRSTIGRRYEVVPIRLSGSGSYRDCALFLHAMRQECPDMGTQEFSLTTLTGSAGAKALFHMDINWYAALPGFTPPDEASAAIPPGP